MPKTWDVEIRDFAYDPPKLTVDVGDAVRWTNRDGAKHTATRTDPPPFDTGLLEKDKTSAPITFDKATGDDGLLYFCKPHPFMQGRVVVRAPAVANER